MKRSNFSVREIMAYDAMNELFNCITTYNELCEDGIRGLNAEAISKQKETRKELSAKMNFYLQLLTHPMQRKQYDALFDVDYPYKIRGAVVERFNVSEIDKEIDDGNTRNLSEFYFDIVDRMVQEGEDKIGKLDDIIESIIKFEE